MRSARRSLVLYCAIGLVFTVLMQWWIPAGFMALGMCLAGASKN